MNKKRARVFLREIADGIGAILLIALMVSAVLGIAALYGHEMYNDWRCGMPGVQCRRVVLP